MRWLTLLMLLPLAAQANTLWLRPLTDIKAGELNQLLADDHVLLNATMGELRVVDANLQPLAGQYADLEPPLRTLQLQAVPLHKPAPAETPMQLAVDRDALVVRLGQPQEGQKPSPRWLLEVPPEAVGTLQSLDITWGEGTHSLLTVSVSASDSLDHWYPRGSATLPPTAVNLAETRQTVKLQGSASRYLLLSQEDDDDERAPELTSVSLTLRPELPLLSVWANAVTLPLADGRTAVIETPATAATSLRYQTEGGLFAATINLRTLDEPKQPRGQWNIYRTASETLATHDLALPASSRFELHQSAPLPAGQWQWGWRVRPYLFLPTGPGPYYLAYGSNWAEPATSITSLLPSDHSSPHLVQLGAPEMRALPTQFPWMKLILIGCLVLAALAVVGLGISQWRTMHRHS